jgi:hypothetical protein
VLVEVEPIEKNNLDWIYYSETVQIASDVQSVCLELSRFPEKLFLMDDVNLETSL